MDNDGATTADGLEVAVTVRMATPAGRALSALREAGARLVVMVDDNGRPRTVLPEATLAAAPPARPISSCAPVWPAATFAPPEEGEQDQGASPAGQERPRAGDRTVVVQHGQVAGVVPVPRLIDRPGLTARVLERVMMTTGRILMVVRYKWRRYPSHVSQRTGHGPGDIGPGST
jgi:hypothetical protein